MLGHGGGIQRVDGGFPMNELGVTKVGHPIGGEDELVAGIFRQVNGPKLGTSVIGEFAQDVGQFCPVSLSHGELTGLLHLVAEDHKGDLEVPDFREVVTKDR